MKAKKHWDVITRDGWPAIQDNRQDSPFIVWANDTALGPKAAQRWAKIICEWMNEQMRLGTASNKPRNCDAILLRKLHEAEAEIAKLTCENQNLKARLNKTNEAARRAKAALQQLEEST